MCRDKTGTHSSKQFWEEGPWSRTKDRMQIQMQTEPTLSAFESRLDMAWKAGEDMESREEKIKKRGLAVPLVVTSIGGTKERSRWWK